MEFPFGHGEYHQRNDEDEREDHRHHHLHHVGHDHPPPPFCGADGGHRRPSYPQVQDATHECGPGQWHDGSRRPTPPHSGYVEDATHECGPGQWHDGSRRPTPPHSGYVEDATHECGPGQWHDGPRPAPPHSGYYSGGCEEQHHHRPSFFPQPHHAEGHGSSAGDPALSSQRTVRIFTKAEPNYSLSIRDGNVILARSDPSNPYQHWIRDLRYSTKVKDEEGLPSFALINKATGEALKHSIGAAHPIRVVRYNPDYLDESVLWTESKDTGEGWRCIRMVNNIRLNFDAFHGDEDHGGVKDGTTIVLWEWLKGDNQKWKIVAYCKFFGTICILQKD